MLVIHRCGARRRGPLTAIPPVVTIAIAAIGSTDCTTVYNIGNVGDRLGAIELYRGLVVVSTRYVRVVYCVGMSDVFEGKAWREAAEAEAEKRAAVLAGAFGAAQRSHLTCAWCTALFVRTTTKGPVPIYCRPSCRQRAFQHRHRWDGVELATTAAVSAETGVPQRSLRRLSEAGGWSRRVVGRGLVWVRVR